MARKSASNMQKFYNSFANWHKAAETRDRMCHRLPAQKGQHCSAKQDQNPENTEEHRMGLILRGGLPTHIHGMATHICT